MNISKEKLERMRKYWKKRRGMEENDRRRSVAFKKAERIANMLKGKYGVDDFGI